MGHRTRRVRSHIASEQATRYRTHTIKEEPSLRCLRCTPLLWQTPVVPRHCQMATATINLQVPSLSGEWTPPVVRQGTTAYPAQLCSHLPYDRKGKRCTLSCASVVAEPVACLHCRLATARSFPRVPSPPVEWLPPVVRRGTTAQPAQHCQHPPLSHRRKDVSFLLCAPLL